MSAPTTKVRLFEFLDMDRGTICRQGVYMYADEPGIYFTRKGFELTAKQAKQVGFDVDNERKERALALEIAKVTRDAEVRLGFIKEEVESEYADPTEGKKTDSELVTERFTSNNHPKETEHYAMKHMGRTLWTVLDKRDGNKPRIEPAEREDAIDWMITHAEEDARVEAEKQSSD